MVSKKKRPPPAIEASDTIPKKSKPSEAAGTSSGTSAVSTSKTPKRGGGNAAKNKIKTEEDADSKPVATDGCPTKNTKRGGGSTTKSKVKQEDDAQPEQEEEDAPENNQCSSDFPDWTPNDLLELMKRMERAIPASDMLTYQSRLQKLDWDMVSFGCRSAQECKDTWMKVQARVRKFRLLRELIEDGKAWAAEPWTHFYRSRKQNRHPDMPRRPLSSYMLFYLATKDKVAKEHPGLEMTEISKYIADMYKALPEKKKKKYSDMAAVQRKEYDEKMIQFYQEHPGLIPKQEKHDSRSVLGPKKPLPPFKLFLEDKLKRHKNDPGFDKSGFVEKCKEQWKNMPDKKKVIWINWACEEEARYTEELKAYMSQNPEFVPGNVKNVLTKEEKTLRESLFSRLMLASDHMKDFSPKQRMIEISRMWKNLQDTQKKKYQERVNHMLDQYKLEYATYLESLPEDKRQEELQSNLPKARKNVKPKVAEVVEGKKPTRTKSSKHPKNETSGLYKGEPEPPPRNEYHLFVKALLQDKSQSYSEKEAPKLWQMLPDADKAKYRKKLSEIKTKYIQDYEKFLNSLSQEELKEYSARKESSKKEHADVSDGSAKDDDSSSSDDSDDEDDDEEEEDQESGSDDSSSDSESGSSDSSESNDGDSKNSGDSSSTSILYN
ncbi:High mobility group protein D, partial [Gryllus bimaculatus]